MATRLVTTTKFRCSFLRVFKAEYNELSKRMEFSVAGIFPKHSGLANIKEAWDEVIEEEFGDNPVLLEEVRPFFSVRAKDMGAVQDGDRKIARADVDKRDAMEMYTDSFLMNMKTPEDKPPEVVDQAKDEIISIADFKSGDYARAVLEISAFKGKSGPAVSVKLKVVQKLADGPAIGGGISAKAALDTIGTVELEEDSIL